MEYRDVDKTLAPEDVVAVAETRSGVADRRVELPRPKVLGRIPDLDAMAPGDAEATEALGIGRRLLATRLRTKILVGGGLALVAVAILSASSLFSEDTAATKGGMAPAPNAPEAPAWNAQAAETADPASIPPDYSYVPSMSFSADLPPAPDFIEAGQVPEVPAELQTPAGGQDRSAAANEPWRGPSAEHQSQATPGGPQAWANQPMTMAGPTVTPVGIYADDYLRDRRDTQANMPARYPAASISYPMAEPGVARLEGVIEKPPIRTTYDSARSSIY